MTDQMDQLPIYHCPVCKQRTTVYFMPELKPNSGWPDTFNGRKGYFAATCTSWYCPLNTVTLPLSKWRSLTDADIDGYREMNRRRCEAQK
jgi:hypothetical protein